MQFFRLAMHLDGEDFQVSFCVFFVFFEFFFHFTLFFVVGFG